MIAIEDVNYNFRGEDGESETPLILATQKNMTKVMEALISKGADPSIPSYGGQTPLHHAAKWNYVQAMEILVQAGANINALAETGETPTFVAA